MQSFGWYRRRLMAMPPGEIAWRISSCARDLVDRVAFPIRRRLANRVAGGAGARTGCSEVMGRHLAADDTVGDAWPPEWRERLLKTANALLENRILLLGNLETDLGPSIRWNHEYQAGINTPNGFAPAIDYRDYAVTGDCKWVWELNRHHHLVVLGRAYRLSRDPNYAEAVRDQLIDWIAACPFGLGMNWRSPLELAIRVINWSWALELIRPANICSEEEVARIRNVATLHLKEIAGKYSRYSSANNHLVGEAAGVYLGSAYFAPAGCATRLRARSREILLQEILSQTYADGGHRELAPGYHGFVAQFFLLAGLAARNSGDPFPTEYWQRLEKMFEFIAALSAGGDRVPMFNDCDDGYVLNLGQCGPDFEPWLAAAAVLFERPDFKSHSRGEAEATEWLFGRHGLASYQAMSVPPVALRSRAFPDSGTYLLQSGQEGQANRISVAFDCGPLGFGSIAAHGHADALSFTLRAFGVDFLVDPGTYDYFTYPEWRKYFRSTRAHNTIEIDGRNQSEMLGGFLWGHRATAKCTEWQDRGNEPTVTAEHDGYRRFSDPVTHRRSLALKDKSIYVTDEILAKGTHEIAAYFHFSEACDVSRIDANTFEARRREGTVRLILDEAMDTELVKASDASPLGWVSRRYHTRVASVTLVGRCRIHGDKRLYSRISVLGQPSDVTSGAETTYNQLTQ